MKSKGMSEESNEKADSPTPSSSTEEHFVVEPEDPLVVETATSSSSSEPAQRAPRSTSPRVQAQRTVPASVPAEPQEQPVEPEQVIPEQQARTRTDPEELQPDLVVEPQLEPEQLQVRDPSVRGGSQHHGNGLLNDPITWQPNSKM